MKKLLLIGLGFILLIVGCEETVVVAPLVCGEGLTDVDGECILVCDEGLTDVDGECYYQGDLDVLQDIIDVNENVGGFYTGLGGETPLEIGGVECKQPRIEIFDGVVYIVNSDYPFGCQIWEDGRIKSLNLDERGVTFLPESIGNLTELEVLSLAECQLTSLPDSFFDLNNLKVLKLECSLTTLSDSIIKLTNLTSLSLSHNELTSLPENIGNLSSLEGLSLYRNQLTTLPESIGNLSSLTSLSIESNQLTTLPESIGNLSSLTSLNINSNQLTTLPESIGNLSSLERLGLWDNKLTALPESFCNLSINWGSRSRFAIWDNLLCPPYPECLLEQFTDTNGNGIWDETEPFEDYGLDGLQNTLDNGEGNGIFDNAVISVFGGQDTSNCP